MKCRRCPQEILVAFSCRRRGLCPSCGAKRTAELAALLVDEVVEDVGHAQWVFTVPKMLRAYVGSPHRREPGLKVLSPTIPPLRSACGPG